MKMVGRPKIFDEENALKKASMLFWKKGYEHTSLDDLLTVMEIQKGSFYNTFGSKKELFIKAINFHETKSFKEFKTELELSKNPIQLIKKVFYDMANCQTNEYKLGCFAGNTIAEFSNIDQDMVDNASKHLKVLENIFVFQIEKSQKLGELKTKKEAQLLGEYLLNFWNGLNITRRIYQDKQQLMKLIELQLEVIN